LTRHLTGIDTNVLVRYITRDDPYQTQIATTFMNSLTVEFPGFISLVVLAELFWVLDHSYKTSRTRIIYILQALLSSSELFIEDTELVYEAIAMYEETSADFDDCLIAQCAYESGCQNVVTFDRKAARAIGMRLLD
jgi:predicted nucleic-acid-binding protein